MRGFWQSFVSHYRAIGGELVVGCRVEQIEGSEGNFVLHTRRGEFHARQAVSTLPAPLTARIAPEAIARRLRPFLERDGGALGGALVVFLGVPDDEVEGQEFTHHQLMHDYFKPLGDGNNMFVSVSEAGDMASAPAGHRAVIISTHCELQPWEGLSAGEYEACKLAAGRRLLTLAQRVYPKLGEKAVVCEVATAAHLRTVYQSSAGCRRRCPADAGQFQSKGDPS
jgi:phytoene dehydrogenase-like protein